MHVCACVEVGVWCMTSLSQTLIKISPRRPTSCQCSGLSLFHSLSVVTMECELVSEDPCCDQPGSPPANLTHSFFQTLISVDHSINLCLLQQNQSSCTCHHQSDFDKFTHFVHTYTQTHTQILKLSSTHTFLLAALRT